MSIIDNSEILEKVKKQYISIKDQVPSQTQLEKDIENNESLDAWADRYDKLMQDSLEMEATIFRLQNENNMMNNDNFQLKNTVQWLEKKLGWR
jgi:hypothetical protein